MAPLSKGADAGEQTGASLITLPDEIQQLIYRYVYPITDIVLRPDDDPDFVPKTLTQSFNILGSHPVSLLLTNSKICAVAKPVRDSSFTGRVNASRVRDLASCGHWIHNNLKTVRVIVRNPPPTWGLHLSLFSNLRNVELIRDNPFHMGSDDLNQMSVSAYLRNEQKTLCWRFYKHAKDLKSLFFSPVITQNHPAPSAVPLIASPTIQAHLRQLQAVLQPPNPPETIVLDSKQLVAAVRFTIRLRYTINNWPSNTEHCVLGVTVVMHNGSSYITSKAILTNDSLTYVEIDPSSFSGMKIIEGGHTEGGGVDSTNQIPPFIVPAVNSSTASAISLAISAMNGVNALSGNGTPNNTPRDGIFTANAARVVHVVSRNTIPRRFAWIKDAQHGITWDDLE